MLYLYLALGGFSGAVGRYFLSGWLNRLWPGTFPLATWIINLGGCLAMGFILTYTLERLVMGPELRLGLTTGMIGAFTTFSTFSVETIHLLQAGETLLALLYLFTSLAGGLTTMQIGIFLARVPLSSGAWSSIIKRKDER
ncbi:fluoride efflux transporter CrcB [Moorella sp. Hama-1]|uniref:fluoride efflux transporter CrcB n=1 Tax=Moorella sp. Hama-1 TaxID=2138101 RepID=UPI000D65A1C5|nr:fluoride efflux transporter CrcB [Moorella sp. Hama-1]MDN5362049.1 fluoride exporter [Moorella sp. (in: firmicutes)]BCV20442.1 putative fluoride ion transporter CrcB 1 [Moorella sp. Hama-1]